MEKITNDQEDSLLDFLDGKLEGTSLQGLKRELESSPALQQRLEELRRVHTFLESKTLQSPSPRFVERVMQNLSQTPLSYYASPKNGLMLLVGVMIASGMLAMVISAGTFDQITGLIAFDQIAPVKKYVTPSLPALHISGKLVMKVLIGINLVLAFLVLDRTILRPLFQRRSGSHSL